MKLWQQIIIAALILVSIAAYYRGEYHKRAAFEILCNEVITLRTELTQTRLQAQSNARLVAKLCKERQ